MPTLGRYQLLERLGAGGMAEVFLARTAGLDGFERLVALKCLLPEHAGDGERVRMFLAEARLLGRLHHKNVVAVHEVGCERGIYFMAMEWVPGADAERLIALGGKMPLEHALQIVL